MRRKIAATVVASALLGAVATSPASADPGIGRPSNPSCAGQVVSSFAQNFGGVHNALEVFGLTPHEGRFVVRAVICGRTSGLGGPASP